MMKVLKGIWYTFLITTVLATIFFFYMNSSMGYGKEVIFEIPNGENLMKISLRLRENNLTRHHLFAYYYGRIRLLFGGKIRRGKYRIKDNQSVIEIIGTFVRGKSIPDQIIVTIPEGYNVFDISKVLLKKKIITDRQEFFDLVYNKKLIRKYGIKSDTLEGYLYPTTYFVLKKEPVKSLVNRMLNTYLKKFPHEEFRKAKAKLKLSRHKIMIIASLIEKETGLARERNLVSSVYHNRLRKRMKMECDPTVIYALLRKNKYKGKLSRKRGDMDIKSKYNTYLYKGLPPSPIANPSRDSIIAALNPAESDYIYFVAKSDKSHFFATNFKDHNKNVRNYREWLYKYRRKQREKKKNSSAKNSG